MSDPSHRYRIALAVIGLFAFVALLVAAVFLAASSPGLAALSGGGAVALAVAGLYKLLVLLGSR